MNLLALRAASRAWPDYSTQGTVPGFHVEAHKVHGMTWYVVHDPAGRLTATNSPEELGELLRHEASGGPGSLRRLLFGEAPQGHHYTRPGREVSAAPALPALDLEGIL